MSLDVYLYDGTTKTSPAEPKIYVREAGRTVEVTPDEWQRRHPDREPVTFTPSPYDPLPAFTANITHNLTKMAEEAGLYEPLWHPERISASHAKHLIPFIEIGLKELLSDRERYEQFNPSNGWGDYDLLVAFTTEYLEACKRHPEAVVEVSV